MKNTSTTFSDVIAFLSSADISTDQHREIVEVINSRVKKARKSAMRSFRTGDVVRWKSKWGYEMTGYVTGLGRTSKAMFFRLEEAFPAGWLYVSKECVKLTVYND